MKKKQEKWIELALMLGYKQLPPQGPEVHNVHCRPSNWLWPNGVCADPPNWLGDGTASQDLQVKLQINTKIKYTSVVAKVDDGTEFTVQIKGKTAAAEALRESIVLAAIYRLQNMPETLLIDSLESWEVEYAVAVTMGMNEPFLCQHWDIPKRKNDEQLVWITGTSEHDQSHYWNPVSRPEDSDLFMRKHRKETATFARSFFSDQDQLIEWLSEAAVLDWMRMFLHSRYGTYLPSNFTFSHKNDD